MNFTDRWETDEETGEQFLFTVEMQRKLERAGLPVEPAYINQLGEEAPLNVKSTTSDSQPPSVKKPKPQEITGPSTIQIDPQTGKYIGQVKWYNTRKGYGFIMRGEGEEIFFHKSGSTGELQDLPDGQWVLYDVEDTKKGPEATDVELYEGVIPD